jgi:hypothetical protein
MRGVRGGQFIPPLSCRHDGRGLLPSEVKTAGLWHLSKHCSDFPPLHPTKYLYHIRNLVKIQSLEGAGYTEKENPRIEAQGLFHLWDVKASERKDAE